MLKAITTTLILALYLCSPVSAQKKKILIFSKTVGFHHQVIAPGIIAIQKLGLENHFDVDTTTDARKINTTNLKKYQAVIFLHTTGNVFDQKQEQAFQRYIQSGAGFVGVHSATNTEVDWPWFGQLIGAYFTDHPSPQVAEMHVLNRNTIATQHLPEIWKRNDEWYNFKNISEKIQVLITVDEESYKGGKNGKVHPIAWFHDFDGGRSFYTGLGHTTESYTDPLFLQHLLGGIQYAMGEKPMSL